MFGRDRCRRTRRAAPKPRPRSRWRYRRLASMEGNRSGGLGTVRSGLLTGISTAAVSGSAAGVGVVLPRTFGAGIKTDGFFASYGVYLALVLVAGSLRVIVLTHFATARAEDLLPVEVTTWIVALA